MSLNGMAYAKFSTLLVATIFGQLVAAQDDLRPLCSVASAQFVVGDTSLFTFEPRGKCSEAQFVFNDSTSLRIDIDGPDCTGLATHHVSLSAATPSGWAEFFLRCDDGGLCKNIFIQPQQADSNSQVPNRILQECLGEVDPTTAISLDPSLPTVSIAPSITSSLIDSLNTYTATASEIPSGTAQTPSINTYAVASTSIMGVDSAGTTQALVATATTPDTYSMESEAAETTQAVADSLNAHATPIPDASTLGSQSTGTTQLATDNFDTYTASVPSTYLLGGQSTFISSYVDITGTANICSCCTSI